MTDDAKEWKTIKVPAGDKQQADDYRPDEATWGDCLVAGAERLNDTLDSDMTHRVEPDTLETLKNELSMAADPGEPMTDGDVERILGRIDDLEAALPRKVKEELGR